MSMSQFKCALSCRAAGKGRSLGTPTRSLMYMADGTTASPFMLSPCPIASAPEADSGPASSACVTCRNPAIETCLVKLEPEYIALAHSLRIQL